MPVQSCTSLQAFARIEANIYMYLQAMGCCGQAEEGDEDKKARKQNKEIEKQIQKDKQVGEDICTFVIQPSFACKVNSCVKISGFFEPNINRNIKKY